MKKLLFILFAIPFVGTAQKDSVLSGIYKWEEPKVSKQIKVSSAVLLEGKVHDFKWLQVSANSLSPSAAQLKHNVPKNQEHLMIIKTGRLQIGFSDSAFALEPGSVAMLIPGEKILLSCTQPTSFYILKYRSKAPKDLKRAKENGGSFVKFWNGIPFKPNNNGGGRRDFFEQGTAMSKRFEMHVTTLKEGVRSHDPHTHGAEEIVLMIEGNTEMQIGQNFVKGTNGDLYYLGSNILHAIRNIDTKPCMYFAFQFE